LLPNDSHERLFLSPRRQIRLGAQLHLSIILIG